MMLGRGVNDVIRRAGAEYPLEPIASLTRGADRFFVNLECAISPRPGTYPGPKAFYFRADPLAADTLVSAGVHLVSLANNHALDANACGLRDTLRILDDKGIAHVGAGETIAAARVPAIQEVGGVRLGVLAWCDHQEDFAAGPDAPGIDYTDLTDPHTPERLATAVAALAARVDHVVVSFHWQANWVPRVADAYRALARRLVTAGARIIWGHSPHHFQGVEWIGSCVVIYSSGDLVDDYALEPHYRNDRQLLFETTLSRTGVEGVRACPIELEFGRTRAAGPEAREWIRRRFAALCVEVGSRVVPLEEWLAVVPAAGRESETVTKCGRCAMWGDDFKKYLDDHGVKYVSVRHSPAYTAQEVAASAHIPGQEMAKTVMVKIDDKLAMAVVPASHRVLFDVLKNAAGARQAELAREGEFMDLFPNCERGAMPPFGTLYGLDVYVAQSLQEDEEIAFNAGSFTEVVRLPYREFVRLVKPKVLEFSTPR